MSNLETIATLVDQIALKQMNDASKSFDTIMSGKVKEALDTRRTEVAHQMYAGQPEE